MELRDKTGLVIVQNLPLPFDRRTWLECKTLSENGLQVVAISPADRSGKYPPGHVKREGIHLYRYPAPPKARSAPGYIWEFAYCWLLSLLLSAWIYLRYRFDIIHACNPPDTFFVLGLLYRAFGVRFLFDHHDLSPEMYLAKGGQRGGLLHAGLLKLEELTLKTADVVVTTNQSLRRVAMERGGVPGDRIFIVRSGPDFERLQPRPPEPELKKGARHMVCYLGEMCEQDGVDILLRTARRIVHELGRRDIRFVLLGGGEALHRLRHLSVQMDLEPYVEFRGRVPDDELCRYLSSADLCVDPDPYSEWADKSTMNKTMEYMTFGKPIVGFDLTENRVSAREAALYVEPGDMEAFGDSIVELLEDPERRREMGDFGRKRVQERIRWAYSKPHLLNAYRAALSPGGKGRPATAARHTGDGIPQPPRGHLTHGE